MDLKSIRPFTQVTIKFGLYSRKLNTITITFFIKKNIRKGVRYTLFFHQKNDLQLYEMSSNIQKGKLKFSS